MSELFARVHHWTNGRFVADAGVYAGRPPSQSDLNSQILEMLHKGIAEDVGDVAARKFTRFVNNLNDLSASSFIIAFGQFIASGCKRITVVQHKEDRNTVTGYGSAALAQGFAMFAADMFGPKHGEGDIKRLSYGIKSEFVRAHEQEIPKSERRGMASDGYAV